MTLSTARWLPGEDAEPDAILRAAEDIGRAIGDHRTTGALVGEPAWIALPARPDAPPSPDERRASIARVLTWAEAAGARWHGIEVHVDAAGNASMRASRDIATGEQILLLPRRLMIIDSQIGALGIEHARPRDTLAVWLSLEARAPSSRWRAYLDALPAHLAELPMFHGDLGALAGTAAHAVATEEARDVRETYAGLAAELRARVSLADFAWGRAIVQSRGFHAPGTIEHRLALLPVVEFFNHRLGDTTWTFEPDDGLFVITTERAFAAGDDVHFPYGARSTSQLLVHFGFTHPNNTADEASLVFDRAVDPVTDVAAHLLWNAPLAAPTRVDVGCSLDHRFLRALSLARLRASGPVERARVLEVGLAAYGDMPWRGGEHERAAFAEIAAAAHRGLAQLAPAVPRSVTTPWEETCAIVRAAERAVLEQIIAFTSAAAGYLSARDPARLRAAAAEISAEALGSRRLLRQYLHALADAITLE